MKIHPCLRRFTAPFSLIAALSTLTAAATFGQGPAESATVQRRPQALPKDTARKQADADQTRVAPAPGSLFDIEISDGTFLRKGKAVEATLQNVVDLLRERHEGANIVLSPGLPKIRIANLKLRATSVEQELEALRVASGYKFVWSGGSQPTPMNPAVGPAGVPLAAPPAEFPTAPLYTLTEAPPGMTTPGRQVEVFNLTDYFNSLGSPDDEGHQKLVDSSLAQIKDTVTSTVDLTDEDHSSTIRFQFHSGANLLVVVGTPDAVEVARKVISALAPQVQMVNMGANPPPGYPFQPGVGGPYGAAGFVTPYGAAPPVSRLSSASSKARRAILNKLESIRLESVAYDGIPLSDVVRHLNDEAKKRDPEKRGINFLINPNPPPALSPSPGMAVDPTTGLPATSPPAEAIDINAVTIKIALPLTNVRLIDVLDAIVKVADHPIRYTITDYAVVFSLRGSETVMSETPIPGVPGGYSANSP